MAGEGRREWLRLARAWLGWFVWMLGANIVVGLIPQFHGTLTGYILDAAFIATTVLVLIGFYRWVKRPAH